MWGVVGWEGDLGLGIGVGWWGRGMCLVRGFGVDLGCKVWGCDDGGGGLLDVC